LTIDQLDFPVGQHSVVIEITSATGDVEISIFEFDGLTVDSLPGEFHHLSTMSSVHTVHKCICLLRQFIQCTN